jgi:hypothetical protein
LLRRGAAVTLGPVFEPYVAAFPKAEVFVENLLLGKSIAESYWLALPHISWAMVILGDPLYRPFAAQPKPSLVARAYAALNPAHVLAKGESGPLLIRLQCVGPAGSGTSAFTAVAEPGMGLAGASGTVAIPPLQAGESTVVQVPTVTASRDTTGMFRLHLNAQNGTRRIALEGRTGFSLVHGGAEPEAQMFVSHNGEFVISGQPGNLFWTETATLRMKPITLRGGWIVASVAFSPDDAYAVLKLLQPEQKQAAFAIADSRMERLQSLPEGMQFLRWLSAGRLLLRVSGKLVEYNTGDRTSLPVFEPAGWTVTSVIPETAVHVLMAKDGRIAIRNAGSTVEEVLAGVKVSRDQAVANDLSLFGGLDDQKRLWVQHGLKERPETLAENVERISWGPISRRVLVEGTDGKFRIYDGRDGSWLPAAPMVAAQWSPDEERLLYIEAERRDTALVPRFLSLLDGKNSERLCETDRLGEIGGMAFTRGGEAAFLLAGADGRLQLWMMALPQRKP